MTTPPTVILDDLPDRQGEAWDVLLELAPMLGQDWTVIGGQMVMLHQAERQHSQMPSVVRFSHDVDVMVNIRVGSAPADKIDRALREAGFAQVPSGIDHRYIRDSDGVVFDVLAPDHLGKHHPRLSKGRTLGATGGTQALNRTGWVIAKRGERKALIPRPDIVGALLIKIAAATGPASARGSERHYEDIVVLAMLLRDDDIDGASLTRNERKRIRRAAELVEAKAHILQGEAAAERLRSLLNNPTDSRQSETRRADSRQSASRSTVPTGSRGICGYPSRNGPCRNPKPLPGGRCAGKHQH